MTDKRSVSLLPVCLIGFLNFTSMTLLYPVVPPYATSLGATVALAGLAVALQPYVAAVTQAPVGMLSDRMGRRKLLIAGILAHIASYFLYLTTTTLPGLMAVRALNGLGNAAFFPAAQALVVDIAAKEKRGEALGYFATGTQLGSMAGPALGGFILRNVNFEAAFLASAFFSIIGLAVALSQIKHAGAGGPLAAGTENLTLKWLFQGGATMSMMATLMVQVVIASVISFLPLYGVQIGIDIAGVGLIIATIYIGSVFTRVQAGRLSDRIGRLPVILGGMTLCAVSVFFFSFLKTAAPLHVAALVMGMGVGSALPACAAMIADAAPLRMRGFAMGLNSGSFNAGLALGSTGLGVLAEAAGFPVMYLVTSILVGVSIPFVLVMVRRARVLRA